MTKIALDVDGVLLNFYKHFCDWHGVKEKKSNKDWHMPWVAENFSNIAKSNEFWSTLPLLASPEFIGFDFDYYLTSLPPSQAVSRKKNLLNLGFPDKPVVVTRNKVIKAKELGVELLVDDKPDTIRQFRANGLKAIYYKPYYFCPKIELALNPVTNWGELNRLVKLHNL